MPSRALPRSLMLHELLGQRSLCILSHSERRGFLVTLYHAYERRDPTVWFAPAHGGIVIWNLILRGQGELRDPAGTLHGIGPGSLCFVAANAGWSLRYHRQPVVEANIGIGLNLWQRWLDQGLVETPPNLLRIDRLREHLDVFLRVHRCLRDNPLDAGACQRAALGWIDHLLRVVRSQQRDPIILAQEWMLEHLGQPLDLAAIAAAAGCSLSTFRRRFGERTGESPRTWFERQRIRSACQRLACGEPIAGVAAAVGYADQFHFSKRFKAVMGISPSRYRGQVDPMIDPTI